MPIGPITTARSGDNDAWLGSRHAVANAHPGTLNAAAFKSAEGVVDGVVPSGYPVMDNGDGTLKPWDGVGALLGFSIDDRDVSKGDEPTAVLWHGRIKTDELPVEFTVPEAATSFTFVPAPTDSEV